MATHLKDQVGEDFIDHLMIVLREVAPSQFSKSQQSEFKSSLNKPTPFQDLELRDRVNRISDVLATHLQGSFVQQSKIIKDVAGSLHGLGGWVLPTFVERHGPTDAKTLQLLKYLTAHFSSEFAIRKFIIANQESTMTEMLEWTTEPNEHYRRLASEGCRPRLPWSFRLQRLVEDPSPILPIL
jgi:hypothetical protein